MLVNVFLLAFFSFFLISDAIDNVIALLENLQENLNLLENDSQGSKLADKIDKRQGIAEGYKKIAFVKDVRISIAKLDLAEVESKIEEQKKELITQYPQEIFDCRGLSKICNFKKAAQSAIKLAVSKWQDIAMILSRRCRTKTHDTSEWESHKVKNDLFYEQSFHRAMSRKKRFVVSAVIGAFFFAAFISTMSYGIAEAVAQSKVKQIEELLVRVENCTISMTY